MVVHATWMPDLRFAEDTWDRETSLNLCKYAVKSNVSTSKTGEKQVIRLGRYRSARRDRAPVDFFPLRRSIGRMTLSHPVGYSEWPPWSLTLLPSPLRPRASGLSSPMAWP